MYKTTLLRIILFVFLFCPAVNAEKIDDFEGGVDWSASPWNDEFPRFNALPNESITAAMSAEWYWQHNDQTAGFDFGYITKDKTKGANGTANSLKATVTGGNIMDNQSGAAVYGYGTSGTFQMLGQPIAGQTFTITPYGGSVHTFTMQSGERTGTGQVQIGSTVYETSQNMASAINEDITSTGFHAAATEVGMTGVTIGGLSGTRGAPHEVIVSEALSYCTYWENLRIPDANKYIYENYNDMLSLVASSGLPYVYYGSAGGDDARNLNTSEVLPPATCPSGSNRMSFYILDPDHGHDYGDLSYIYTHSVGTYIGNADLFAAGGYKEHFYHNLALVKSQYWTKVIITEKPDFLVGVNPVYLPNDPTWNNHKPSYSGVEYQMHYMESLSHFYVDLTGHDLVAKVPPWSIWLDEFFVYTEPRTENNELIGTRSVGYNGSGKIHISWTGPHGTIATGAPVDYDDQEQDVKIYWAKNEILNQSNFLSTGTLAGTYTKGSQSTGHNIGIAEFVIPDFDETATYSFALSPQDAPTTAGFIDYKSGAAGVSTPSLGNRYRGLRTDQ